MTTLTQSQKQKLVFENCHISFDGEEYLAEFGFCNDAHAPTLKGIISKAYRILTSEN
jgi:hypothetical protein